MTRILSAEVSDFVERGMYSLKRTTPGSSMAIATCDKSKSVVHVYRGTDPAELVHIALALLDNALDWMDAGDDEDDTPRHPMYNAVSDCMGLLEDWDVSHEE